MWPMLDESESKFSSYAIRQKIVKEKIHMDDEKYPHISTADLVQLELKEAKKKLGGTWDELSTYLSKHNPRKPTIAPELLRKYASGVESISKKRALSIANSIAATQLAGPKILKTIEQLSKTTQKGLGILPKENVESNFAELTKLRYANARAEKVATENLRKALNQLSEFVWNRHELEYIALAAIQEITRYEGSANTSGGGLLTPHSLPIFRKQDCRHEHVVLTWSVSSYLD
jgi:hypothetical protein